MAWPSKEKNLSLTSSTILSACFFLNALMRGGDNKTVVEMSEPLLSYGSLVTALTNIYGKLSLLVYFIIKMGCYRHKNHYQTILLILIFYFLSIQAKH